MAQVVLDNIAGTGFYAAPAALPAPGPMLFLRWSGATAAPITLDDAWSDAAMVGYILFPSATPSAPAALAAAEKALRDRLVAAPPATSFTWAEIDAGGTVGSLDALLLGPGEDGARLVQADFVATGFPQFPSVPIAAGTRLCADVDADGFVQGATIRYPPLASFDGQPAAVPAWGGGVKLPLTGPATGCLQFEGLIDHATAPPGGPVQKDIYELSLDPLDPYDPDRTYMYPTGRYVILVSQSGGANPFALEGMPPE